jgi:hypothetical protein
MIIFQVRHATITVDTVESLTSSLIKEALAQSIASDIGTMDRSQSQSHDVINKSLPNNPAEPLQVQRSELETTSVRPLNKTGVFSLFLRRHKNAEIAFDTPSPSPPPPPLPPKDVGRLSMELPRSPESSSYDQIQVTGAIEEKSQVSQHSDYYPSPNFEKVVSEPVFQRPSPLQSHSPPPRHRNVSIVIDPAEKIRRRIEKQKQKEEAEKHAMKEEFEQQAFRMKEKQEALRREEEEEAHRRASLHEAVRKAMAARSMKERELKEAEERRLSELREKKMLERAKRMAQSKLSEERRKERARLAKELLQREELGKKQEDEERKSRIKSAKAEFHVSSKSQSPMTGWVTIQTNESPAWKRRFFELVGTTMFFYRSAKVCVHFFTVEIGSQQLTGYHSDIGQDSTPWPCIFSERMV